MVCIMFVVNLFFFVRSSIPIQMACMMFAVNRFILSNAEMIKKWVKMKNLVIVVTMAFLF
jgi:hypothetical protein